MAATQTPYTVYTISRTQEVWLNTTDAPFRERERAIEARRTLGIAAVEMEAAALYAFAAARSKNVICFAHVTNQMGQTEGDFEKGEADGTADALAVIAAVARGAMNFA
jgi:purine-nucleoside phosphorylase